MKTVPVTLMRRTLESRSQSECASCRQQGHIHAHPFNGPLSGTTQVSRYQKGKTNLDFTEARDSEWQWHQLCHMQVCTSLQTDNHASMPPLSFYRPYALPATQPTASKHWRQQGHTWVSKLLSLSSINIVWMQINSTSTQPTTTITMQSSLDVDGKLVRKCFCPERM